MAGRENPEEVRAAASADPTIVKVRRTFRSALHLEAKLPMIGL